MAKPIALQLYTLREEVYPGGKDLPRVMKTVAEIGYMGVELAGLHGHDPKQIAKVAADLGLTICGSHLAGVPTADKVKEIADEHAELGNPRVIGGFGPQDFETLDAVKSAASRFQEAAELLKPYEIKFGFHNHWWEFNKVEGDDRYVYEILLDEAPDAFSELDVYWCSFGKADPVSVISKYKSRIHLMHVKDGMLVEGDHSHTPVGSGKLNMPAIIGTADPVALDWLIVELDSCAGDMLEAVKKSYRYLVDKGLATGAK
ncbi:MAG: sugar phosphate isomerase/epimerase [Armatimonadetes bacterium]|nr:sugar phosphate isomerase/epimerase [Armatimonadota bacterium]